MSFPICLISSYKIENIVMNKILILKNMIFCKAQFQQNEYDNLKMDWSFFSRNFYCIENSDLLQIWN